MPIILVTDKIITKLFKLTITRARKNIFLCDNKEFRGGGGVSIFEPK